MRLILETWRYKLYWYAVLIFWLYYISYRIRIIHLHIDGLVQDCSNYIANALELLQSCTKPSTWSLRLLDWHWGNHWGNGRSPNISETILGNPGYNRVVQGTILPTWISVNPVWINYHIPNIMCGKNYLSIPKLQLLNFWKEIIIISSCTS